MSLEEIEKCIEGTPDISVVGLNPGYTNSKIEGNAQEDAVSGEGKITFDIRTHLRLPGTGSLVGVKILIDVEAQKDANPGYCIPERAIYYCSRMISAQLATEFSNSTADRMKYHNLKKVYSIWICTESPADVENTVEKYSIHRTVVPGQAKKAKVPRYDLMEAVIVNISKSHNLEGVKSKMLRCLTELFDENIDADEKIRGLQDKYGIATTEAFDREVHEMTAFTAGILHRGLEKGREEGMEKGRLSAVATILANGCSDADCIRLGFTAEEVARAKELGREE